MRALVLGLSLVLAAPTLALSAGAPQPRLIRVALPDSPDAPQPSAEGAFVYRGETDDGRTYLRLPDPPAQAGAPLAVWTFSFHNQPTKTDPPARFVALLYEYDCQGKRLRSVAGSAYGDDGQRQISHFLSNTWFTLREGVPALKDLEEVCSGALSKGPTLNGLAAVRADDLARRR